MLTDNGACYKSKLFTQTLTAADITHKKIRPCRPQTNGKAERFNRTLLDEWACLRPYTSNTERTVALADFLHTYNHHRCHTAFDGHPPINRVNNVAGQYIWGAVAAGAAGFGAGRRAAAGVAVMCGPPGSSGPRSRWRSCRSRGPRPWPVPWRT